ncbi:YheC/YheD family protein [Paenibacillus camelliae]|uniref:YheC/YheD family endospore coat-associated protein n=1 Tax=Paenibacillus camelliae TaxID=512410 RepID=UPI00203C2D09|nr:YheC/YheD family protein [Paenibacillus camelliae]MCM3632966.1 YheC/YheD family protein [Paenibacillus camelliae]
MIGILYSRPMLQQLMKGRHSFEMPEFYIEAARKTGENIVFFSLYDINWSERTVLCWDGIHSIQVKKALPSVIINRTRTSSQYSMKLIKRLKELGILVINEYNVVSKLEIHRILSKNNELTRYLPDTHSVTYDAVKKLLKQYDSLFLKPSTASVGQGVIRIRKSSKGPIADINVLGRTKSKNVTIQQIVKMIKRERRNYLVQQGISLMSHEGKLVDFRVSVQKNGNGKWQYTGIVGRMAQKGAVVTNLHCRGKALKASDIFQTWGWNAAKIEKEIANLGIRIAETLDKSLPHVADIGLDIALDEQQHPWLIEVNFRDLRITFRDAKEEEKWKATFANPIKYAAFLNKTMKENTSKEHLVDEKKVVMETRTVLNSILL